MTLQRSVKNRELLIEDDIRAKMRHEIDPVINRVFSTRSFTEIRSSTHRTPLDSIAVTPSEDYLQYLGVPYDGLSFTSVYNVDDNERDLIKARINLVRIGGLGHAALTFSGGRYYVRKSAELSGNGNETPTRISASAFNNILEDVRAHTELGYSHSDTTPDTAQLMRDIESTSSVMTVDQRTSFEEIEDTSHDGYSITVGRSFEEYTSVEAERTRKRRRAEQKLFQMAARTPLEGGHVQVGLNYLSGARKRDMRMQISTVIESDAYSSDEKSKLYEETVKRYQDEEDVYKFGRGVVANLQKVIDAESTFIRLG